MPTSDGLWRKQGSSRKTSTYVSLIMVKLLTVRITKNCKILKRWETHLLRNRNVGQEATIRIGHGTTGWFKIGKEVHQSCILSLCLFNLYAVYIIQNARLDEPQAGINIAGKNINVRYTGDTTLMAENEEELKNPLMKVKQESKKAGLKLNMKKKKKARLCHPFPSLHGK